MAKLIETQRLLLRPFERDDAVASHAWFGDPVVMKYTPSGPDASVGVTRERLARYEDHQARHGFSKWLVLERSSGQAIGDAGLLILEGDARPERWRRDGDDGASLDQPGEAGGRPSRWIDLGFRFQRRSWHKGYATEVGAAWVSVAFGSLGFDQLNAFVHPENVASMKVLERLGFLDDFQDEVQGMPAVCFTLRRLGRLTKL
jgi:[ribosomal protein S5]-alanine N-acetyltransferase